MTSCLNPPLFVFLKILPYICTVQKKINDMIEKLFKSLVVLIMGLGSLATIAFFSVIGGTFVYWLWPVAIPAALPGLVENGILTGQLMWWPAVCLTWLCGILIKSTQTVNNKK